ncbi:UDP-N-acetylmuramate dehydrogenase [Faecalicatena acetigenes]|uniref:UDP-N-acetylenolpyruvoylglucosamine reductase n=2 Tax=Lachnospiraceae TaxID=186803 RepID=A0ABT2T9V1_9FIRM|nr:MULTISPECIES: UDP-N-acetylmuramate dehydrogenase [Lachnospiraceae]MCU6747063.1 UDP-N-acetylmuramate dehydrogenase [Faecalicatena acetigenes]
MERKMDFYKELCNITGIENVLKDEPMSRHTTFKIGGPADYFITPTGEEEIERVLLLCRQYKIPFYIMGNGSNLLVGDKGYRGVVLQIFKRMNGVETSGKQVYAQAGALLSKIAAKALEAGLTGFEFASGIPGTLGGALMMNAGAYGGEMKQVLKSAKVLDQEGHSLSLSIEQMDMGYRTSIFSKNGYLVLSAVLELEPGDKETIQMKMEELRSRRVTKQPLEYGSAGSTFKRPEGYFAGKLIEEAGLRGFRVGDAQVSEKHCGFVINRGSATAAEVTELMEQVIERVEKSSGVRLEPEVKRIGEF